MIDNINIRTETTEDEDPIQKVIEHAFANHPFSNQTEHLIVNALRKDHALSLSLVAELNSEIVGHIAFSEVLINGKKIEWYGLAPVSILPKYQNRRIGTALIKAGLSKLKEQGANGCVLVGEPDYYSRFGFNHQDHLFYEGVPIQYFMALPFKDELPEGEVTYHPAFST